MNRKSLIALAFAASATAAFADDITIDPHTFVSTASRAEIQAELAAFEASGRDPWARQYNPLADFESQRSREEVKAEYVQARDRVAAFTGEDSGSAYLAGQPDAVSATTVAGDARNPS
ncbi:DUF4148 domain-containing protein [Ramlibacter henchirensis]|uniref:DUF4148 domain-containing protein n=1 Tax=Ramlibacter henchirensis TaxID=204072 RepID=A0A4Z0C6H4_9BURK|nr:DUF4148 domain-containing protein [Ramlibacter henchirensis]TFZ05689.1 DUF4148 domain-containing protein [Ramlibacter henchirensis]